MTARSRWVIGGSAIFLVILIVAFLGSTRNKSSVQARGIPSDAAGATVAFASPGRVEGASETTQVGAAADGILKAVYVKEDQFVRRGTLLGEIACDDLQASLQTAMAEADGARQTRTRLLRGARDEEKKIAIEKTAAARATFEEDKARADAEVQAAEGRVRTAQERIGKCAIVSPIDGTVLRVYARRGESFSTVTPRPLFSLADTSSRHIKAEIDERDVDKVSVGQRVVIQADALDGKRLNGSVARISAMMGRKSISTGDPSDKSDRDILEAVIDLKDTTQQLPIGLRVTVQFLSNGSPKK